MIRPYAEVIGDPIGHSKSPLIHSFWLGELGIDADYRARRVRVDELADYFAARRADADWRGCNVTIPHKQAVLPFLDGLDMRARSIGAVNTIYRDDGGRLLGTNTDVDGVREAVTAVELADVPAVVIGSGGAARAAFALLAEKQVGTVRIWARSPIKAREAARQCGLPDAEIVGFAAGSDALQGAALLINATQLGMEGQDPMPAFVLDGLSTMAANAFVFDMIYAPLNTPLLRAARDRNLRRSDGLVMLIAQAATAFSRFFAQHPPRKADGELRAMLTAS